MENAWIDKRIRPPTAGDADHAGCILVWHRYQGVMVSDWRNAIQNRYITHWMIPPSGPNGPSDSRIWQGFMER